MSIILAVIGILLSIYAIRRDKIKNFFLNKSKNRMRNISLKDIYQWLNKYYEEKVTFYHGSFTNNFITPFIVEKEWLFFQEIQELSKPLLLPFNTTESPTLTLRQKKIINDKKENWGQNLFNGRTLCLSYNPLAKESLFFSEIQYFDLAGCILEYEKETYRAINNRFAKTPLRNKYLSSIDNILKGTQERRISLGGSVVTCIKDRKGSYKLLLHKRSDNVITARGAKSVIPQFGFEPISKQELGYFSFEKYPNSNLIIYNIFKEFVEELFNYEELVYNIGMKRTMGFFSDIDEVKILKDLYDRKLLKIIYLGHGFDALIGTKILAFILLIDDHKMGEEFLSKIDINWEVDNEKGEIEEVELNRTGISLLDIYQKEAKLTSSSAFAISRAIEWLNNNNYIDN